MPSPRDLYAAPASEVDYDLVRAFVLSAEAASQFSESLTFEAKKKRHKSVSRATIYKYVPEVTTGRRAAVLPLGPGAI